MKIEPIDERLLQAISHVSGFAEEMLNEHDYLYGEKDEDGYHYLDNLKESLDLVIEYTACFGADGRVSQRGHIPTAWNKDTIFESDRDYKMPITEEASAEQKDANAKKLLEEIT